MLELLIQFEAPLRFGLFASVFTAMAAWEIVAPRRILTTPKAKRWFANLAILVVNTAVVRALAPAAAVGIAMAAEQRGIGLLNFIDWPLPLEIILAVIVLDLVIYLQHVMFHTVPLLWRLHRVHHADLDIDVTTGTRFHPVEILLSMAIKAAAIFVTGAPVAAVLIFEIVLNLTSMFNHANARIQRPVDAVLRLFVVTPDMHRVHHSIIRDETDSNFGFNLPWWDRLFGTYCAEPRGGHERMAIGVPSFRDPRQCISFTGILFLPFLGESDVRGARNDERADSTGRAA
jgi:sterol desaturase/sphingolipid hydroxylase (fatty acid hydroxylase superfamily)